MTSDAISTLLDICPRAFVTGLIAQRDRLERERDEARRELAVLKGRMCPIILAEEKEAL